MTKYIKTQTIEVVEEFSNGDRLVQNTGDSSDRWEIPKDVFESTYKPVNPVDEDTAEKYTFGDAIEMLKVGSKMARAGWNGKGMFIYHVAANRYPATNNNHNTMKGVYKDDLVPYQAYIAFKTVDDTVVPWLASQTDMLAEDWTIVD